MGNIRQYQRRAIERLLFEDKLPNGIAAHSVFLEGGDRLFVLGVSCGLGSCSDVKGVDVLVLGKEEPRDIPASKLSRVCQCAVLLRRATWEEYSQQGVQPSHQLLMCVERLKFKNNNNQTTVFISALERAYYISTC